MRALIVGDLPHRQIIGGAAKIRLVLDELAELFGDARQRAVRAKVAFRLGDELLPELVVAEGNQDGREIADELVEGGRLRQHGFDVVGTDAVQHRVAELVVDDVGREAGEDAFLAAIEVVELERFALAIVVGVLAGAGVGDDDQPVALEAPGNGAAEPEAAFEEVQGALHERPGVDLVELRDVRVVSIEPRALRIDERARLSVPACRRRQRVEMRVVVDHRKPRARRPIGEPRLPRHGAVFVERQPGVAGRDQRVLEVDVDRDPQPQFFFERAPDEPPGAVQRRPF